MYMQLKCKDRVKISIAITYALIYMFGAIGIAGIVPLIYPFLLTFTINYLSMDLCSPDSLNQETCTYSETHYEEIVLQKCQVNFSSCQKFSHTETDHQFDTICEDSHFDKQEASQAQEKEPGFSDKFNTPEKTVHQSQPSQQSQFPILSPFQSPLQSSPSLKPQKNSNYITKKNFLQQKSQQFQRNFKHQQKLFALCFEYMNQEVANRIAEESGIATQAFIKRKKQAQRNNRLVEQFMEMMDCESVSSWSSNGGRKRRNWFRRVSRKDVRTVVEYLKEIDKEVDVVRVKEHQDQEENEVDSKELDDPITDIKSTPQYYQDTLQHLQFHSLFIQNLPPHITYSELEKYLQNYGEISHFLILDHFGRRKRDDPLGGQLKQTILKERRVEQQSKIIGFVEFVRTEAVEVMLNEMKERKLRYFVKREDTQKEKEKQQLSKEAQQPLRKISQDSVQDDSQEKKGHKSRKIYVRQVDWQQMLKPQQPTNRQTWINKKQQKQTDQSPIHNNPQGAQPTSNIPVTQTTNQPEEIQTLQIPTVIYQGWEQKPRPEVVYEGWEESNDQSRKETQKKQKNLEKLNMLRLKLKLIKSAPTVKVEPQDIVESESQVLFDEKLKGEREGSQDDKLEKNNQQRVQISERVLQNSSGPVPIIEQSSVEQLQVHEQHKQGTDHQNLKQSTQPTQPNQQTSHPFKNSQTQTTQTSSNCTQTDCPNSPNMFKSNQQNSPRVARRCQQCQSREKRANRRSIEKQIQITVGVRFSSQVPFKSALGTFYFRERVEQNGERLIAQNVTEQNLSIHHGQNVVANEDVPSVNIIEEVIANQKLPEKVAQLEPIPIILQNQQSEAVQQWRQSTEQVFQQIQLEKKNEHDNKQQTHPEESLDPPSQESPAPTPIIIQDKYARTPIRQPQPASSPSPSHRHHSHSQHTPSSSHQSNISSSSSSIYSSSSPIHIQPQIQKPTTKPKSFFQYSLWQSDQDGGDLSKNKSRQWVDHNGKGEKNLMIEQRLYENGLSNSPIVNEERHKGQEEIHEDRRDDLPQKHQKSIQKSSYKAQQSSGKSSSSKSRSSWSSSSSNNKQKSISNKTNRSHSNRQKTPYKPRYLQQEGYKRGQDRNERSDRYDRNRHSKREEQTTSYRNFDREKGYNRFGDREDNSYRGRNQRYEIGFREGARDGKYHDRKYENNSKYHERDERYGNRQKDYNHAHKRIDTREFSRKHSDHDDSNSRRNYESKRNEDQRKQKFSRYRNSKEDDYKGKSYQQKEAASKKWKYSEYMEQEKPKSNSKGHKDGNWHY